MARFEPIWRCMMRRLSLVLLVLVVLVGCGGSPRMDMANRFRSPRSLYTESIRHKDGLQALQRRRLSVSTKKEERLK
tara:strand:+ start:620 stop:850 length:231 start_codon:yes stop_codon:yes gene_type:complete